MLFSLTFWELATLPPRGPVYPRPPMNSSATPMCFPVQLTMLMSVNQLNGIFCSHPRKTGLSHTNGNSPFHRRRETWTVVATALGAAHDWAAWKDDSELYAAGRVSRGRRQGFRVYHRAGSTTILSL